MEYGKIYSMRGGWAKDFSYVYFQKLLKTAKANFDLHSFSEIPIFLKKGLKKPRLVLRHDIDVSLKRALIVAEIEKNMGIRATYMVLLNSPLYSLKNKTTHRMLKKLLKMNHEVGIHFNINDSERNGRLDFKKIEKRIVNACKRLENIIEGPVLTVSFHRPIQSLIGGSLLIGGKVNAYAKELMGWYLSDAKGYWREGEPLPKLLAPKKAFLQLLIHPIWWGKKHMSAQDRLQEFFEEETKGEKTREVVRFSAALAKTIVMVQRKGLIGRA